MKNTEDRNIAIKNELDLLEDKIFNQKQIFNQQAMLNKLIR